jgi:hypothetical protein
LIDARIISLAIRSTVIAIRLAISSARRSSSSRFPPRGSSMTHLILPVSLTRRTLLKTAAAASVALTAPALLLGQDPTKGGKRYRTALIGCGWWGGNIVREAIASGQCQIVALCDADLRQVEKLKGEQKELTADSPKVYQDFRELLDKEKPEIVIVATPDHWHPLITIAAVQAGADVYVEKPVGHTILEGRAMVKAARDTSRMVQVGTHRRVSPHNLAVTSSAPAKRARLEWSAHSCTTLVTRKIPKPTSPPPRDSTGICGVDPHRCGPSMKRSMRKGFAISSTMRMERSETGAFTGWTRSCG